MAIHLDHFSGAGQGPGGVGAAVGTTARGSMGGVGRWAVLAGVR